MGWGKYFLNFPKHLPQDKLLILLLGLEDKANLTHMKRFHVKQSDTPKGKGINDGLPKGKS